MFVEIVVLPEDVSSGVVSYQARDSMREKVPNGGASPPIFGSTVDLVGGGADAPGEVLGELERGNV